MDWSRPVALYNQDSPTTTPIADEHGVISGYVQVTGYGDRVEFKPHDMIHVTLDAARPGATGQSPMQATLGPVTTWLFASATGKEAFKKGLPPNLHADFPAATKGDRRPQVAGPVHDPQRRCPEPGFADHVAGWHGGQGTPDRQDRRRNAKKARDEILSIFGVPPARLVSSSRGTSAVARVRRRTRRTGRHAGPIDELVIEALNYPLAVKAFGITDWKLKFGEIDYRDSQIIEGIRDQRLRNGSWTLNRYRQEIGEPPVDGGDDPVLVHRQNLVLWSQMADMSQANIDAKANKGKPAALPPSVTPPALPAPGGGQGSGDGPAKPDSQQYAPSARGEANGQPGATTAGREGRQGEGVARPANPWPGCSWPATRPAYAKPSQHSPSRPQPTT